MGRGFSSEIIRGERAKLSKICGRLRKKSPHARLPAFLPVVVCRFRGVYTRARRANVVSTSLTVKKPDIK